MRWIGFAAGLVVILGTAASLTRTLIVPRGLNSSLSAAAARVVRAIFILIANRFASYRLKDRVLAFQGAITMLAVLFVWLASFLAGYGLLLWPLVDGSLGDALRQSGSSLFTLGFASATGAGTTTIHFCAAATGLVVVALQIAYLPTLYAAFNRRETLVTTLQSRAGVPAWGPEILARHHSVDLTDNLRNFYEQWETWAADVAESHANYPVLLSFRSPHPLRSWLLALLAVMDSAALYNALCPSRVPAEARIALRMGFTALRDIAHSVGIDHEDDPMPDDPIQLTYEEFTAGIARLQAAGFPMERAAADAWPHFRGWRVNYEAVAYALADRIVAPPGPWSGPRAHVPGTPIEVLRPIDRKPGGEQTTPRRRSEWTL